MEQIYKFIHELTKAAEASGVDFALISHIFVKDDDDTFSFSFDYNKKENEVTIGIPDCRPNSNDMMMTKGVQYTDELLNWIAEQHSFSLEEIRASITDEDLAKILPKEA